MRSLRSCDRGVDADGLEDLVHSLGACGLVADLPDVEAFTNDVANSPAWVQRRDWVLKDHLELRPDLAQVSTGKGGEFFAFEEDRSRGGVHQLHDRLAHRGLTAAGFTDEAQRLAGQDIDAHVGDGVDLQAAATDGKLDKQVLDPQHTLARRAKVRGAAPRHQLAPIIATADATPARWFDSNAARFSGVPTGNQHRNAWCGSAESINGGSSARHLSWTYGHRGEN